MLKWFRQLLLGKKLSNCFKIHISQPTSINLSYDLAKCDEKRKHFGATLTNISIHAQFIRRHFTLSEQNYPGNKDF